VPEIGWKGSGAFEKRKPDVEFHHSSTLELELLGTTISGMLYCISEPQVSSGFCQQSLHKRGQEESLVPRGTFGTLFGTSGTFGTVQWISEAKTASYRINKEQILLIIMDYFETIVMQLMTHNQSAESVEYQHFAYWVL